MSFSDMQELWTELQKRIKFIQHSELAMSVTGIDLRVMKKEHWNWLVEMDDLYSKQEGLKNMDITFVLAKIHDAFVVYTNTGNMPAAAKRSVTIQLTDGQIKQIHKQKEEDVTDIFIESYSDK